MHRCTWRPGGQRLTSGGWMDGGWTDGWRVWNRTVGPDQLQTQSPRVRVLEGHQSQRELATGTEGETVSGTDVDGVVASRTEDRRQGQARRRGKVGDCDCDSDSDSDLRLPPGRWLWLLDRFNLNSQLSPSLSSRLLPSFLPFLPSGLAAMVTTTSLHEVHLKEESK